MVQLLVLICFGLITAYFASKKGKHPLLWFIIGGLLPIIGLIILLLLKTENSSYNQFVAFFRGLVIVISITVVFVLVGTVLPIAYMDVQLKVFGTDKTQSILIQEVLTTISEGKKATIEDVASASSMYHSKGRGIEEFLEDILKGKLTRIQFAFGFIGFLLSLLLVVGRNKKQMIKESYTNLSETKVFQFLTKWRKKIIISLIILIGFGYSFAAVGYYYKQFNIERNPENYYFNQFEKRSEEPLSSTQRELIYHFLNGEEYIIKGVTIKEAEDTKGKFKIFGYILGLSLIFYLNKPLWSTRLKKPSNSGGL
ncbi:hypothetical protein J14TS2_23670 [Bacillus sp. J14TS2]|uniref:hypothetical protein n=1 Tax=Bacillus sp. J14TS2 TaxID=2807188 RepID=UPI001AFCFA23|nr:hypothetical protein [Bacillus sp. J14TS2]GIN71892.1 hypothetical protein J14TS2_23670 [Bacillus sp. J14TS2]